MMRRPRHKLTPRERAFINAYLESLDGPTAVLKAGMQVADPREAAARMLRHGPVRRHLDRVLSKRIAGPQELMGELSEIATAPWRDFVSIVRDEEGNEVSVRLNLREKVAATKLLLQAQGKLRDRLTVRIEGVLTRELDRMEGGPKAKVLEIDQEEVRRLALPPSSSPALLSADTIDAEMVEREGSRGVKVPKAAKAGKDEAGK